MNGAVVSVCYVPSPNFEQFSIQVRAQDTLFQGVIFALIEPVYTYISFVHQLSKHSNDLIGFTCIDMYMHVELESAGLHSLIAEPIKIGKGSIMKWRYRRQVYDLRCGIFSIFN